MASWQVQGKDFRRWAQRLNLFHPFGFTRDLDHRNLGLDSQNKSGNLGNLQNQQISPNGEKDTERGAAGGAEQEPCLSTLF